MVVEVVVVVGVSSEAAPPVSMDVAGTKDSAGGSTLGGLAPSGERTVTLG